MTCSRLFRGRVPVDGSAGTKSIRRPSQDRESRTQRAAQCARVHRKMPGRRDVVGEPSQAVGAAQQRLRFDRHTGVAAILIWKRRRATSTRIDSSSGVEASMLRATSRDRASPVDDVAPIDLMEKARPGAGRGKSWPRAASTRHGHAPDESAREEGKEVFAELVGCVRGRGLGASMSGFRLSRSSGRAREAAPRAKAADNQGFRDHNGRLYMRTTIDKAGRIGFQPLPNGGSDRGPGSRSRGRSERSPAEGCPAPSW